MLGTQRLEKRIKRSVSLKGRYWKKRHRFVKRHRFDKGTIYAET